MQVFQIKFNSSTAATLFAYLNPQPDWLTLKFLILGYLLKKKKTKPKNKQKNKQNFLTYLVYK